jgi:hypothetical protein
LGIPVPGDDCCGVHETERGKHKKKTNKGRARNARVKAKQGRAITVNFKRNEVKKRPTRKEGGWLG